MSDMVKIENIKGLIVEIRAQRVFLDSDIVAIYGVETKRVNEAVKNNPDKFPQGFFLLGAKEYADLQSKKSTTKFAKTRVSPKEFTKKGLYMRATILTRSPRRPPTLGIIETFSKLREFSRNVKALSTLQDKARQKTLMQRSGELMAEILENDPQTSDAKTIIDLNFAVLKFKHAIKKKRGSKH